MLKPYIRFITEEYDCMANYPDADKSRFFASGRLPFMLTADVTIGGTQNKLT
jgi:hypothetical protein